LGTHPIVGHFYRIQMDAISGGVSNRAGIIEASKHLGHTILRQQDHVHGFNAQSNASAVDRSIRGFIELFN